MKSSVVSLGDWIDFKLPFLIRIQNVTTNLIKLDPDLIEKFKRDRKYIQFGQVQSKKMNYIDFFNLF